MEEQMELFEEGGLKEEGGMVDEESGNDVPTGSSREEVRDDIPAMLSEGEFVFPADVVRFHGLEKLMELRQEAKMGIKKMEAMGQMGNADEATLPDDIPFTMDDLIIVAEPAEPKEKAHGGVIHAAEGTFVPSTEQERLSTGILGRQSSIYSNTITPLPTVTQPPPPSSVVPVQPVPAPTTGFSPLYQAEPTPQVAPTFDVDAVEFTGVDPEQYSDSTQNEATESVGTANVGTTQTTKQTAPAPAQEGDGDKDAIRQLKEAGDRERQQANYKAKQDKLETGSADDIVGMWLDNKRVLGAGQALFGASPIVGGLTSAAGLKEQEDIEKVLDARFKGWREGKGLSADMKSKLEDYEKGGFFRNTKAFGNKLFEDAKNAAIGFASSFTKEGRTTAYTNYAQRIKDKGPQYNVADNRLSGGATGFEAVTEKDGSIKMNQHGMPQSSGNLSLKEQQSYDNAVRNGDAAIANHHAIISAHRDRQNRYADALNSGNTALAAQIGENMSTASKKQAERFGGSVHRASETGTAEKKNTSGTGFFSKFVPDKESKSDSSDKGSNTGGYSCYVATALNDKGYWPTIKKIKLIKWCMDSKPEDKFDTKLWRNGYTVFGKTIIAPHVDNKLIQWLSDGFYNSRVRNKKDIKSLIGLLFFYVPSYTIALYKMLRNDLVDIERT